MACKKCGDPKIDSRYKCSLCTIKTGTFKWCVITKANDGEKESNHYDRILTFNEIDEIYINNKELNIKNKSGLVHFQEPVFTQGEIFPAYSDFGRELCAAQRKPSKWGIEYEIFNSTQYKEAVLRALEVTEKSYEEPTNLDYLEQKYIEKAKLIEKQQKLKTAQDPIKIIYDWIKQNHISLQEAKILLKENI